jgi:hypothetical protein
MPFTKEQFFHVIYLYNLDAGAGVWILYVLAFYSIYALYKNSQNSNKQVLLILSFLWLWMGIEYHWGHFTKINPAAWIFGAFFVIQSVFLATASMKNWKLTLHPIGSYPGIFQSSAFLYSLLIYPFLGQLFGHGYPFGPIFGLPCPTTIFTLGMLAGFTESRSRKVMLSAIPVLWAIIGSTATLLFGVYEDYILAVSAILFILIELLTAKPAYGAKKYGI